MQERFTPHKHAYDSLGHSAIKYRAILDSSGKQQRRSRSKDNRLLRTTSTNSLKNRMEIQQNHLKSTIGENYIQDRIKSIRKMAAIERPALYTENDSAYFRNRIPSNPTNGNYIRSSGSFVRKNTQGPEFGTRIASRKTTTAARNQFIDEGVATFLKRGGPEIVNPVVDHYYSPMPTYTVEETHSNNPSLGSTSYFRRRERIAKSNKLASSYKKYPDLESSENSLAEMTPLSKHLILEPPSASEKSSQAQQLNEKFDRLLKEVESLSKYMRRFNDDSAQHPGTQGSSCQQEVPSDNRSRIMSSNNSEKECLSENYPFTKKSKKQKRIIGQVEARSSSKPKRKSRDSSKKEGLKPFKASNSTKLRLQTQFPSFKEDEVSTSKKIASENCESKIKEMDIDKFSQNELVDLQQKINEKLEALKNGFKKRSSTSNNNVNYVNQKESYDTPRDNPSSYKEKNLRLQQSLSHNTPTQHLIEKLPESPSQREDSRPNLPPRSGPRLQFQTPLNDSFPYRDSNILTLSKDSIMDFDNTINNQTYLESDASILEIKRNIDLMKQGVVIDHNILGEFKDDTTNDN